MIRWNASFQLKRSTIKVSRCQKPQKIAEYLVHMFTYGQQLRCRLQTRPNPLLDWMDGGIAAYHVGTWHWRPLLLFQCLELLPCVCSHCGHQKCGLASTTWVLLQRALLHLFSSFASVSVWSRGQGVAIGLEELWIQVAVMKVMEMYESNDSSDAVQE